MRGGAGSRCRPAGKVIVDVELGHVYFVSAALFQIPATRPNIQSANSNGTQDQPGPSLVPSRAGAVSEHWPSG